MLGDDDLYNGGQLLWGLLSRRWQRRTAMAFLAAMFFFPGIGFSVAMFIGRMETKPLVDYTHRMQERLGTTTSTSSP